MRFATVVMKVSDLVGDGGCGGFALEMVTSYIEERIKRDFKAWVQIPMMCLLCGKIGKIIGTNISSRVKFYATDFGWGWPIVVHDGLTIAKSWKLRVDAGKEGSLDIELFASFELLEALGKDPEFKHAMAPLSPRWLPTKLSNKVAWTRL
ncbi:uncharacterized protein LOC129322566 [Prosopis cineraria]|uniref:uncharacterized protein LOC129322566 n=1 Tax=Prosopis cineraria TaxID=364024 RepID=UPI00240F1D0C|nr:uncharacterized protein LOC129322566 [Prosopis cineraria]